MMSGADYCFREGVQSKFYRHAWTDGYCVFCGKGGKMVEWNQSEDKPKC